MRWVHHVQPDLIASRGANAISPSRCAPVRTVPHLKTLSAVRTRWVTGLEPILADGMSSRKVAAVGAEVEDGDTNHARYAPAPSSPAARRLWALSRKTEPTRPPFHQSNLVNLAVEEECTVSGGSGHCPSEVPTPGRWIGSGRKLGRDTRPRAARSTYPLKPRQVAASAPNGPRPRAKPICPTSRAVHPRPCLHR
jgi:hypothetical protein